MQKTNSNIGNESPGIKHAVVQDKLNDHDTSTAKQQGQESEWLCPQFMTAGMSLNTNSKQLNLFIDILL